jgi:hypothetical protein
MSYDSWETGRSLSHRDGGGKSAARRHSTAEDPTTHADVAGVGTQANRLEVARSSSMESEWGTFTIPVFGGTPTYAQKWGCAVNCRSPLSLIP